MKSGKVTTFQDVFKHRIQPFIGQIHSEVGQLEEHVEWLIKDVAEKFLSHYQPRKVCRLRDKTLSQLCAKSKVVWKDGGRPTNEPLHEGKCFMHKEVRKHIKLCTAFEEIEWVQRREHYFK